MIPDDENKESRLVTIIAAEPGWFVAVFIEAVETSAACFVYDPIIAWEIRRERGRYHHSTGFPGTFVHCDVYPITVAERVDTGADGQPKLIKRPDGRYEAVGDCVFESEQDAIKELSERAAAERKGEP
jgi:hypothetical protein